MESVVEILLYWFLRITGIVVFLWLVFRRKTRFEGAATAVLFCSMEISWILLKAASTVWADSVLAMAGFDVAAAGIFLLLLCVAVDEHPGLLTFVFLMFVNVGNLATALARFFGQIFFPEHSGSYDLSASLTLLPVNVFLILLFYLIMHRRLGALGRTETVRNVWRYLWIIPAIFLFFWMQGYFQNSRSILEMKETNYYILVYLLLIGSSSWFNFWLVCRMAIELQENIRLREENRSLTMQKMEENMLSQRISEARRTQHDLRHHVTVMENYVERGDTQALRDYLSTLKNTRYFVEPMRYCENAAANAVIGYFAQQALEGGVEFTASVSLPENIAVTDSDLSVLLGNLLENAVEATARQKEGEKRISIKGGLQSNGLFAFTVDNTCAEPPRQTASGELRSSKHSGLGIGTASIRDIASRYGGIVHLNYSEGLFEASVLLYL